MRGWTRAAIAGCRLELHCLLRSPLFLAVSVLEAVTFLVLVSLFGLTGSNAPTALVDNDHTALSTRFTAELSAAHHSFALRPMSAADADDALHAGRLVSVITIPAGFGGAIQSGSTVTIPVTVDNVDVDLTDDVQRALPSAIAAFGRHLGLPELRVRPQEVDVLAHDTGYIPYLVVSALALDALVVAGILAASSVAREAERRTLRLWLQSPAPPSAVLAGKLLATAAVALTAVAVTVVVVVAGYRVVPVAPWELLGALALCVVLFTCVGAWLGSLLRRSLAVVPLLFGLAMPLYVDSGALEPERFDGDVIWAIAHASPVYYAVGVLENAFHGLRVTPEPIAVDLAALVGFGVISLLAAWAALRRVGAGAR